MIPFLVCRGVGRELTCSEDLGDTPQEVVQPQKEHNKILRMSGYLLTMSALWKRG